MKMLHSALHDLRTSYKSRNDVFDISTLTSTEPIAQFKSWMNEALQCTDIKEPNAMALATSTISGIPSVRYVLLKEVNENGFQFFTNCLSKKGKHLAENPVASSAFYWPSLHRQIRIEGNISLLSPEIADKYFKSRPRGSQISALVSECQSEVLSNRKILDDRHENLLQQFKNEAEIPRPEYWVGYNLSPVSVEFWQGQTDRLHDRILFRLRLKDEIIDEKKTMRGEGNWLIERLSP